MGYLISPISLHNTQSSSKSEHHVVIEKTNCSRHFAIRGQFALTGQGSEVNFLLDYTFVRSLCN